MERYLMLLLFLQPSWTLYESFLCPSLSEWRFRSNWYCNGTSNERYTCLYHEIQKTFVESCIYKPDSLDPGEQYIISHHPRGVNCINEHRFQPFRILLNGGPECIFRRSMCSEEGQIIFNNGTFRDDRSCRCNFKKGFALNITTQHPCQCIPSKEDCSCYKKHCPTDYVLTPDYVCVHRNNRTYISSCPDISPKSSIKESDNKLKHKLNDDSHDSRQTTKVHAWLISALVLIIVILVVGFIFESVSTCFYCITCPPKDFTVSNEADYLKFTWSNPAYLPIPIKEYRIYFTITNQWNDEDFWPVEPDNLYFSKTCSDILPSRFYRFRISTYINNSHKSKHSDEIDICVPGDPPFNFNVTARKYLAFTWSKPNIGSDYIRHYNIYFTTDDSSSYNWENAEPFSVTAEQLKHNWTDANIIPSKTYRFRISTYYDNSVESKQSNEITCVIGDVLPPKKFKSRGGNGTVELHWTKAENVLFQTEKYKIEVSTDNWQTIVTKKDISSEYSIYTITEVDLMKVYHFKIYSYSKGYFSEPEEDIFFAETAYEVRVPLNDDNIGNECADSNHPLNKSIKDESHDAAREIIEDVNQNLVVKHIDVKIGSVYVVIIIACEGFDEETTLREAFKERLKRGFFGKFKASTKGFEFMTLNRPMPPQHIDVDTNGRNVQVSWSVPPQTFFRTKNFIIQYTTGDGKDPKEKLVSSEYLKCSILLDSSAKFIQLTMCTEIKKSIRSVPSSEKWTEIKHDTKETIDMETKQLIPVEKNVEIEKEGTVVPGTFDKEVMAEIPRNEIRLVFIGKTGNGKSSTCNTIIGEKLFPIGCDNNGVTTTSLMRYAERFGKLICLVVTQGQNNEYYQKEIKKCINFTIPGPHAIILVVHLNRFTVEDVETVNHFCAHFGGNVEQYVIVLFTRFDDMKREMEKKSNHTGMRGFIENLKPPLKEFLSKCGNRYIEFDNTLGGTSADSQVQRLLDIVDNMVRDNGGLHYTNEDYEIAEKERQRRAMEIKKKNYQHEQKLQQQMIKELQRNRETLNVRDRCTFGRKTSGW